MLDIVVTAGFDPVSPDPLAAAVGAPQKALIDVAGRPLVWWTVQALRECPLVGRIVVVGIDPALQVDLGEGVECLPNLPDHMENVISGVNRLLAHRPDMEYGIIASGDVPMLRPETVSWLVNTCLADRYDFYYPIVQDQVMEVQFPGAGRSYVRVREGRFCGGDIFVFRTVVLQANLALARRLMAARKNPLRQASMFGWKALVKVVLGRLTIAEGEKVASRLLGCRARVIISPHADLGMDVDKPHQLEMARRLLAARAGAQAA
jgi:GTP:adenosylcobinamide-phosphate guanylyltransferase